MTGRKIKVPGYEWKKGKIEKKSSYADRNRERKKARRASKMLRGKPLL